MTPPTTDSAEIAWEPLTPRGVAAFGQARLSRLLLVQLLIALLAGAVTAWFVQRNWAPVISAAIAQMPAEGIIRGGQLDWPGASPVRLGEGHFLALAVDLKHEGQARSPAHVQAEFGERDVKLMSLLGYISVPYPRGYALGFNRSDLAPWWGAWRPALLALVVIGVALGLMCVWALLATAYSVPVSLVALFADRALGWRGSWRLSGAALMPGAIVFTCACILYGLGALDLVQLGIAWALHLVIGWVYLPLAIWNTPRVPGTDAATSNPFTPSAREETPPH